MEFRKIVPVVLQRKTGSNQERPVCLSRNNSNEASRRRQGEHTGSLVPIPIRALIPLLGPCPHDFIKSYFSKFLSPNTIKLRI
jgi:hypothetical protein